MEILTARPRLPTENPALYRDCDADAAALPRIGHSAPVDFQRIEDLAQAARASLRDLGRATEGSDERSHKLLGQVARGAFGQISIYAGEAA